MIHLIFKRGFPREGKIKREQGGSPSGLELMNSGQVDWPLSPRDSLVSVSPGLGLCMCATILAFYKSYEGQILMLTYTRKAHYS